VIHRLVLFAVLVVLWIGPSYLVGRIAARKGRSFGAFFAAALLLIWPVVLVVALVIPRRVRSDATPLTALDNGWTGATSHRAAPSSRDLRTIASEVHNGGYGQVRNPDSRLHA
jgi:hypothetical protein